MREINWNALLEETTDFTQRLIKTPSMPTEEQKIAQLVADEMKALQYDEVWIDDIGNVNGRVFGADRNLGALVFNSHLDHVDPGDLSLWPYPPFSAEIHEGRIFGRGACDIKGPLAVQTYSLAPVIRSGLRPKRDVVVSAVVQEETGGAGAIFWAEVLDYPVDLIVLGEPSSNQLSLGHRGIWQTWVRFDGRSVHASVPESGSNPNYALALFLERLKTRQVELGSHPILGDTSVSPTIIEVDTQSPNVTPAWTRVLLDIRTATESVTTLEQFIEDVGGDLEPIFELAGPTWSEIKSDDVICGFYTSPTSEIVGQARSSIERGLGWKPELTSYKFATDGRHFAARRENLAMIGYSPGEEHLAHTVKESISLDMMLESLRGHFQLIREF